MRYVTAAVKPDPGLRFPNDAPTEHSGICSVPLSARRPGRRPAASAGTGIRRIGHNIATNEMILASAFSRDNLPRPGGAVRSDIRDLSWMIGCGTALAAAAACYTPRLWVAVLYMRRRPAASRARSAPRGHDFEAAVRRRAASFTNVLRSFCDAGISELPDRLRRARQGRPAVDVVWRDCGPNSRRADVDDRDRSAAARQQRQGQQSDQHDGTRPSRPSGPRRQRYPRSSAITSPGWYAPLLDRDGRHSDLPLPRQAARGILVAARSACSSMNGSCRRCASRP